MKNEYLFDLREMANEEVVPHARKFKEHLDGRSIRLITRSEGDLEASVSQKVCGQTLFIIPAGVDEMLVPLAISRSIEHLLEMIKISCSSIQDGRYVKMIQTQPPYTPDRIFLKIEDEIGLNLVIDHYAGLEFFRCSVVSIFSTWRGQGVSVPGAGFPDEDIYCGVRLRETTDLKDMKMLPTTGGHVYKYLDKT